MKTPNYIVVQEVTVGSNFSQTKTLEAGSFVRPIEVEWLPKHVLESDFHHFFNPQEDTYVYCFYGIYFIPKNLIRRVD